MLYVQHWSFKTGYHQKGAEKFLGGGGDYPGVEMIGRYHAPGSLEGWIVLKTDDPKAIYQHAAEWAEFLNWETTPVFTDEEAGPIVAKVYSQIEIDSRSKIRGNQLPFFVKSYLISGLVDEYRIKTNLFAISPNHAIKVFQQKYPKAEDIYVIQNLFKK